MALNQSHYLKYHFFFQRMKSKNLFEKLKDTKLFNSCFYSCLKKKLGRILYLKAMTISKNESKHDKYYQ